MDELFSKKPHLLIVDDTPQNIQILGKTLREEGYEITVAVSGEQAIKVVGKILPDLILLDIMMPEMDGFETCERLQLSPQTQNIPVIFLTALTDTNNIVKGFDCGAVDYITKPFRTSEVVARVKTQLELKFSKENLLQRNTEQKELIHILCHDLNNPISAVRAFLGFIKDRPDLLSRHIENMFLAMENAADIIELVRNMRKLEEEKLPLTNLNLKETIHQSIAILQQKFSEKNIELLVNVNEELAVLAEKTSFINSVLNNILTNAIKFSFPDSKIIIVAQKEEKFLIIKIRDFGIGMSQNLLNDIFDMSKSTSRKGTNGEIGTGFGMLLMKKFITAYHGTIEISSKEKSNDAKNYGTEITLTLNAAYSAGQRT